MKIIAIYNIKGGVGKTASTVNLAYLSAQEQKATLIWDLDPQAASTFYFRIKPKIKGNEKKLVAGKIKLSNMIKGTDFENLDLLPADFSYRHLDLALDNEKKPTQQIKQLLTPFADEYDTIFLDCPPSISLLSENIFKAADYLLVPMIPTTLSERTLEQLTDFINKNKEKSKLLPFFSMIDLRKTLHREMQQHLPKKYPNFLSTQIPYSSEIEKMGIHRAPVFEFSPHQNAAKAYLKLWEEIKTHL